MLFAKTRQAQYAGILGMMAAALLLPGCGGSSSAYATFNWNIYDNGGNTPLLCSDVGAGFMDLTMKNQASGQITTGRVACSDTHPQGASPAVPLGTYDVQLDLYGDPATYKNSTTKFDSQAITADLRLSGPNDLGPVDFSVNSFVLAWSISSAVDGSSLTCADAGASTVELDVTFPNQTTPTPYTFDCREGTSATLAIPMGSYVVSWQAYLLDSTGTAVTGGTNLLQYQVHDQQQADLGTALFEF